jgi:MFS family permease
MRCNEVMNLDAAIPGTPFPRRLLREPRRPQAIRASPRAHWYVVGTVCVGAFMGQLDASIVTLALPRIGANLHAGSGAARWVALSYMLVLTGTLIAVGRLADRVGRKLLYMYGFAVFTAGSALCGLAPDLDWLVAARVLQGLGAALLQANSIALIAVALPPRELARGLGVQGAAQAGGLALGPVLGGLLLALGGWRLIFLVNVPTGLLGLALGWLLLPRSSLPDTPARRSAPVAVPVPATPPRARACVSVHATGQTGRSGRTSRSPLALGLAGAGAAYLVMFGALYVLPYFLAAQRIPVALAGLQLAALPLALGLTAPIAGRLAGRLSGALAGGPGGRGLRAITAGGLLAAALGLLELAAFHDLPGRLLGLVLVGAGLGAFIPVNNAGVMSAATRTRAGELSGILNTTRSLATAAGVALAGLIYASATHLRDASAHGAPHAISPALAGTGLTITLLALAAIALAAALGTALGTKVQATTPDR